MLVAEGDAGGRGRCLGRSLRGSHVCGVSKDLHEEALTMLLRCSDVFHLPGELLGSTDSVQHRINLARGASLSIDRGW